MRREGNKTLNSNTELVWRESYAGSENTMIIRQSYHTKFICQFENIASYPFDIETCTIDIIYGGPAANLVSLQPTRYKNNEATHMKTLSFTYLRQNV